MEQTLTVIKPDGVQRKLIGTILSRFEEKGFTIIQMKLFKFSKKQAEEFYSPHSNKSFYPNLVKFIISGPVVAIILQGDNVIKILRQMIGATISYEARPGTIRGDFGLGLKENIIHAADSPDSFDRESKIIF